MQGTNELQNSYGQYNIVVLTDGDASDGHGMQQIVYTILKDSPIKITTIGFCVGENHSLHQPGQTVYKTANKPEDLAERFKSVLTEAPAFNVTSF